MSKTTKPAPKPLTYPQRVAIINNNRKRRRRRIAKANA
jgi:hypothetical protein